jgi:hypothetical protein
MLSVVVVRGQSDRIAGLLAALTEAVVEGLVRDVTLVAGDSPELLNALCEATGARLAADFGAAVAAARSELILVAPPELRMRDGWVERLGDHLRDGGREALLQGLSEGWLRPAPRGVLIARSTVAASAKRGPQQLARKLGPGARRLR